MDYRDQLEAIKNDPASKELQEIGNKLKHPEPDKVYKCTDAGNSEMFADRLRGEYLYIPEQKTWYRYGGKVWEEDINNFIVQDIIQCLRQAQKEAVDITDEDRRSKTLKWLLSSESQAKISAALNLMSTVPFMCARINQFDRDDMALCVQNGVIDLKTGQLQPHNKEKFITKICNVAYKSNACSQLFETFLNEITEGNEEKKQYLQKLFGYCLTGTIVEQEFYQARGAGENGKTVLFELIKHCLGSYAITASPDILMQKDLSSIPNDIARLQGARMVLTSEPDPGKRFSDNAIKSLTGGDTIIARYLHKEFFEFQMRGKIIMLTNHEIRAVGTDHGLWRRVVVMPFTYRVPETKKDKHLKDKLIAEAEAVLSWMVQGCLMWQQEGLKQPEELSEVKEEYRRGQDAVGLFLDECCSSGSGKIKASELYAAYRRWCDSSGEYELSNREFSKRLREKGYISFKSNITYWNNIILGVGSKREIKQVNTPEKKSYKDLPKNSPTCSQVPITEKPWWCEESEG